MVMIVHLILIVKVMLKILLENSGHLITNPVTVKAYVAVL